MAYGFYNWLLFNKHTKKVANFSKKPEHNLLLDSGLENISTKVWADNFLYCFVGDGDDTELVSQTSLSNQLDSSNNYFQEAGANKKQNLSNGVSLTRTFVFDSLTQGNVIREVGVGPDINENLLSRLVLESPVTVSSDEALIVQYTLIIYFDPSSNRKINSLISGIPSSGNLRFQIDGLAGINSDGSTNLNSNLAKLSNEPSKEASFFLSKDDSPTANFNNAVDRSSYSYWISSLELENYTPSNFYRDKRIYISKNEANDSWSSFGLGENSAPYKNSGLVFVFDSPFNKNTYLNLTFRYKWGRLPIPNIGKESNLLFYFLEPEYMTNAKQNPLLTYFSQE